MTDAPPGQPARSAAQAAPAAPGKGAVAGPDGRLRCPWGMSTPDYVAYHDTEWGRQVRGDQLIFERLCLEAFQSGLSWLTILRKRENFRAAFAGFDIDAVAAFGEDDVARLLADAGIVRNRAKIRAAINNAETKPMHERGFRDPTSHGAEADDRYFSDRSTCHHVVSPLRTATVSGRAGRAA